MTIYFIQADHDGPIKIGFTDKPPFARFSQLQCANHRPLTLLAILAGGIREEAKIHRRFDDLRLHGEWFSPGKRLLAYIAGLPVPEREPLKKRKTKWTAITTAEEVRIRKAWFDRQFATDKAAAEYVGLSADFLKRNLGPSGRDNRLTAERASKLGKLGAAASPVTKAKTDERCPNDVAENILNDHETYPTLKLAMIAINRATNAKGKRFKRKWNTTYAHREEKAGRLNLKPRRSGPRTET